MARRTPLGWLNLLLPSDRRVGRIVKDIQFGPDARHSLDVYCPVDAENAPVLLFIYGGGWHSGQKSDYRFAGRAFAAAGFVTIIADYRLVPDVHYPAFLEDAGLALHWIDAHATAFGGDRDRLFLMGHSAGAYNAMMMGLDGARYGAPELSGRLKGVVGLSGPFDFHPFDVQAAIDAFSQAPEPELTQPINLVGADVAPLFLVHGEKDTTCLPRNTQVLAEKVEAVGGAVETRYYDNLAHAGVLLALFKWLRWRAPVYADVVRFMRARAGL